MRRGQQPGGRKHGVLAWLSFKGREMNPPELRPEARRREFLLQRFCARCAEWISAAKRYGDSPFNLRPSRCCATWSPGPDPSTFAYVKGTTHRNLFRLSLQ